MPKYKIYAGLGGGFGGADFQGIEEHDTHDDAETSAWERACEIYDTYDGLHGLRTVKEIMEEDEIEDEEEAEEAWRDERESWLDYKAVEVKEGESEEDE